MSSQPLSVGVVNFQRAIEQSLVGKRERTSFQAMQDQMTERMEATKAELQEAVTKLQSRDHLYGISPEAGQQLQLKAQQLSQTLETQRQHFHEVLQQAEMKMGQLLNGQIRQAAQMVAKQSGLDLILQGEATLFFQPTFEITDQVVIEMDALFERESADDLVSPSYVEAS